MIKIAEEKKDPLIGKTIGRYVVEEWIGRGSFGTVYKARHAEMNEFAAIKTLDPNLAGEKEILGGIFREIELIKELEGAELTHIIEVIDVGFIQGVGVLYDGQPYITMEYMNRGSVQDHYHEMELDERVSCIIDAIKGLQVAHNQGVIHRDIRLCNILIDTEKGVKLSDFSIGGKLAGTRHSLTKHRTRPGVQKAPEQDEGISNEKTDVWHVGTALLYATTGLDNRDGVIEHLMSEYPDIHPDLKHVIADCSQYEWEKRPKLAEVRKRLEKIPRDFMNPVLYGMIQDGRKALISIGNRYKEHKFRTLSPEDIEELYTTLESTYDAMRTEGYKVPIGDLETTVIGFRNRDDDTIFDWVIQYYEKGKKRKKITKEVKAIGMVYQRVVRDWISHTDQVVPITIKDDGEIVRGKYKDLGRK